MGKLIAFYNMGVNLGFSEDACNSIYTDQGVNSVENMGSLSDGDVTSLMRVVLKPGGGMMAKLFHSWRNVRSVLPAI